MTMKILVIQQKMIGDVLITSVLCDNLKKAYPNAIVDYLVYESTIAVLKGNTSIDNLVLFKEKHRKNKWELLKFLWQIRKANYDIIIDAYAKIESFLPVIFSKAPTKISFDKKSRGLIFNKLVFKSQIPTNNLGLCIEQRLSLLDPLELKIELETFPKIYVTDDEADFANSLFAEHNIDTSKKTIMVSILGSSEDKTYPLHFMASIIDDLALNYDVNILFNYIPSQLPEALTLKNLCKAATQEKIYFSVLGKNIREFISIMNVCDVIIGNDGGAINMAKSLRKPSFIIFSPWIDKKGWATFEDGVNNISVHLSEYKPEIYLHKSAKEIQNEYKKWYLEFKPTFFKELLDKFYINHLENSKLKRD